EQAHQQVMLQLALSGQRAAALAQYAACRRVLQAELGAEPAEETTALYERIRAGELSELVEASPAARQALPATPRLVGRTEEYARLQHAWQNAAAGQPHFVVISGEAGIGKTRLAEELVAAVVNKGSAVAGAHLHASDRDLVYAPVIAWLRSEALRTSLPLLEDVWLAELARLLPEILTKRPNLRQLADLGQRQRLIEALARAVLFSKRALLLVIDDAQWCDRATLEWLPALLRHHPDARLLILATVRAEDVAANPALTTLFIALRRDGCLSEIELSPLDHDATVTLAQHLTGAELDATVTAQLYHETEGHPLFVVETIHAGRLERGDQGGSSAPMLPLTVQSVIRERLMQLSSRAQRLVSTAATIGRIVRYDVLAEASGADENSVIDDLDELLRRRILREHGVQAYDFTHGKLREVAYGEQSAAAGAAPADRRKPGTAGPGGCERHRAPLSPRPG
ncbi:MAG TPA: AAA family ATPase, partial [Herpetosiphonaceae bacterium]|nr:AAA family ATPase [Herpetosiphonaceae bacterium]